MGKNRHKKRRKNKQKASQTSKLVEEQKNESVKQLIVHPMENEVKQGRKRNRTTAVVFSSQPEPLVSSKKRRSAEEEPLTAYFKGESSKLQFMAFLYLHVSKPTRSNLCYGLCRSNYMLKQCLWTDKRSSSHGGKAGVISVLFYQLRCSQ